MNVRQKRENRTLINLQKYSNTTMENKTMKNGTEQFHKEGRTQAGFTLVELAFAVSILMLLSALGGLTVFNYKERQEDRATELAAQSALLGVMKAHRDYDENTTVEAALEYWKQSYGKYADITVEAEEVEGCVRVKATNKRGYTAQKENGYGCYEEETIAFPAPEPERIDPNPPSTPKTYTDEEIRAIEEEYSQYRNIG